MNGDKQHKPSVIEEELMKNRKLRLAFIYFIEEHDLTAEEIGSACYDWELFWTTVANCWNKLVNLRG